jgi:hypothetical protein
LWLKTAFLKPSFVPFSEGVPSNFPISVLPLSICDAFFQSIFSNKDFGLKPDPFSESVFKSLKLFRNAFASCTGTLLFSLSNFSEFSF